MIFLLVVLLVLAQNHEVNCTIWDRLAQTLTNVANHLKLTMYTVVKKVSYLINHRNGRNNNIYSLTEPPAYSTYRGTRKLPDTSKQAESVTEKLDYSQELQSTPQLAFWHGYSMESHTVRTDDGYLLTLHRIAAHPYPAPNRTVLLHHGIFGSSSDWILLGPKISLPYILSAAGYDVWIANARGNYYSRGHMSMTEDISQFWNFGWQEMGQYDLPAVIDYIRNARNTNESINFIGHSLGATALLVLLSTRPHYNQYLRMAVLLAPLAYMNNVEGPLRILTTISGELVKYIGEGEFLPSRRLPIWLAQQFCSGPKELCANPLFFISGVPDIKDWSSSFLARVLYHVPAGVSSNTLLHYLQIINHKKFHKFNDTSSEFSLDNVTVPMVLFSSSDDWLAPIKDVLELYFRIQNPIDHHVIRGRKMTHTDFVWGIEAQFLVFNKIMDYLENGLISNSLKTNEV